MVGEEALNLDYFDFAKLQRKENKAQRMTGYL